MRYFAANKIHRVKEETQFEEVKQLPEKKFSWILPLMFAIVLAFGVFLGTIISPVTNTQQKIYTKKAEPSRIENILGYINNRYVDSINTDSIVTSLVYDYLNKPETLNDLFKQLDPHSSYIPKEELQGFTEDLVGNFDGIGIEFNILEDTIYIVSALSGGPSEKAGILSGDKIIRINDSTVAGVNIETEKVMHKLKGKKGTEVQVDIKRDGEKELLHFNIVRDKIPVHSMDIAYLISGDIGYLKLNKFSKDTPKEFDEGLKKLIDSGMKKLILDLRSNPGGYLNGAVDIADEFIDGKKLIVYTDGRVVGRHDYNAQYLGKFEQGEVVVLINENSASASEILAGALQDNKRATIVGRRSFGKGLVQEIYDLPDSSALRLTVARYYTPSGKCIQRSYDHGVDAYYEEYTEIMMNGGELPDSLKRKIDVNWGIKPDVYVKHDTSDMVKQFNILYNRGLIQRFAYTYYSVHTKQFATYTTVDDYMNNFSIDNTLFAEFIKFANAQDSSLHLDAIKINGSRDKIDTSIKAYIARQKWNDAGYYPVMNKIDEDVEAALKVLQAK